MTRSPRACYALQQVTSAEPPLQILIGDADAYFRRGLRETLHEAEGMRVVGEASDGEHALQLTRQLRPFDLDVVLLDPQLPAADGIATATRLLDYDAELSIVFLAQSMVDRDVFEALHAGAVGYLSKHMPPEALVRALQAFAHGESLPIPRAIGEKILANLRARNVAARPAAPAHAPVREPAPRPVPALTRREQEVFDLIARGARDREIAEKLVVSQSTVKKHVQNMLRKLQVRNRAQAIASVRGRG
jgi:DNA-binding NarL/FixJ family response regulator